MRKLILVLVASLTLLQGCARNYKVIVDSKGMTGAYSESRASEITDDIRHCKDLGKENTSAIVENSKIIYNVWWRASTLWLSDKAPNKYKEIVKNCLEGRNHKVVY
tara:strand:- start:1249 stop:1566 length:318 start_codon:yes stop_codon:yes gene_type:complete